MVNERIKGYYQQSFDWLISQFGNRIQMLAVIVLAGALALDSADKGALSVTALSVQHYFNISKADFGVLGSITTGVGALATLPFGIFIDRAIRTKILLYSVVFWGLAMILSGISPNYPFLIGARVLLSVLTAVTYPAIASLLGDYFMPAKRGRAYGWVLSGELIGAGIGIVIAGGAASIFSTWRAAEFALILPAALVIWGLIKLPEPERGVTERKAEQAGLTMAVRTKQLKQDNPIFSVIEEQDIQPYPKLVITEDPRKMTIWDAVSYALKVRTNRIIIVATALGYFFFTGLYFFAIQFIQEHYHISRTSSSGYILLIGLAAISGVLISGRFTDWWLARGHFNSRIVIPAITYFLTAVFLAAGIYTTSIGLAVVLFMAAGFFFEASNPPLDAARLDIMLPTLWGRAESTRTVFVGLIEAMAPVTFGLVADSIFAGPNSLEYTFLIMLIPLVISSVVLYFAIKTYARDVATTSVSIDNITASARKPLPEN